jgi:hypothetical protein
MALSTYHDIGLMALVALRAFNVASVRQMILVRVLLEIFGPIGNGLERFVAGNASLLGCRCFGLFLPVAARARNAGFLVAVRSKGTFLGQNQTGTENNRCDGEPKYPLNH